jgi:anti-sigma regulatory factor (Ser/Thr protein kinase)
MLGGQSTLVAVTDATQVGQVRRAVTAAAQRLGLDETATGAAAVVATEAATNVVKHGGGGEVLIRAHGDGIEIVAIDKGPGIADIAAALRDGYSTMGTVGNGMGAMRRMATFFDLYSAPGLGTAVLARILARRPPPSARLEVGAVSVPKSGETLNGDSWVAHPTPEGARLLVVDGLGHGPDANAAAHAAVEAFRHEPGGDTARAVETCHLALRSTRGAALAVAEVDVDRGLVRFTGLGNVAGSIWKGAANHHTVSMNGTAGHGPVRTREFSYPFPPGALLIMATDGLATRWTLDSYPGLASRDPTLVAAVLYRDYTRGRDDITVVVAREARGERP